MIHWDTCRRDFEPDGALRDSYVHDTTVEHWRTLFDALRATCELGYSVDGTPCPLPTVVDETFTNRQIVNPSLSFYVGDINIACHFFTTDEIEFDISPRDVMSQAALDDLLAFMRLIGGTLERVVILTYENDGQHPFISFEPSTSEFRYNEATV
jgi:hypothetical protein